MKALLRKKINIMLLYFMIKDITIDTIIKLLALSVQKLVYLHEN